MSSTEATQSDKYALVSSFYGPGAVGGWYLTAFACLISFSLHPRQRRRDSITADFIAVLTFPTVAAANLITQVRSYPKEGTKAAQNAASIEATLNVTTTFVIIDVVLYLSAASFLCLRRACLLATVGLLCTFAVCHVYFSPLADPAVEQQIDGLLMTDFGDVVIRSMTTIFFYIILVLGNLKIVSMPSDKSHAPPSEQDSHAPPSEQDAQPLLEEWWLEPMPKNWAALHSLTFFLIWPCLMFTSSRLQGEVSLPSHFLPWIRIAVSRIVHDLIPTSNTSVKELDQVVALLAGATVLGFSLYSTADAYYQARLSNTRAEAQQEGIELRTLNRNQAPRPRRRLSV